MSQFDRSLARRLSKCLLLLILFSWQSSVASSNPYQSKLATNQNAAQRLIQQINKIQRRYSATEKSLATIEKLSANIALEIANHQSLIEKQTITLENNQAHLKKLRVERIQQLSSFEDQLKISYQQGDTSHIKLLLSQTDPATNDRMNRYNQYFFDARQRTLADLKKLENNIKLKEQDIHSKLLALKNSREDLDLKKADLDLKKKKKQQLLVKIKRETQQSKTRLQTLEDQRNELENLLSQWKSEQQLKEIPLDKLKGKLSWPVQGKLKPLKGQLSTISRKGIFIQSTSGGDVKSIYPGQVIFADWLRGYGLLCIIDHGNDYLSLYGHNESLAVKTGEDVSKGQKIAIVGTTGDTNEAGVYFELRHQGQAKSADKWLAQK